MTDTCFTVTNEDFAEKVLQASQLVIVYFYAENSNSCQIQEPELEAASKDFQERIAVAKVNVESEPTLTQQWEVDGIPTLVFFKAGKEVHRIKGIMMRDKLRRQIEGVLLLTQ
ncbi:thioredoxin 1 [Thermosporothrix hazakensis]|jgi:thioredoxin|uniref:Thioredoxin n=2 Tax=Thermosporothrix TaxID=768650 RepID=A0A326UCJ2_THEHA|nr:thioredoxin domain-containing protein [Thermosporothrix hazakensis]PZW36207.1 thioredoxin 1 [Thermosporothrix hazakensis]BBH88671.1 thioredoxin [Thermosporothrix sp. COM3]GCE46857.1 thioredoxin [Thermosporothrix hazakensis]